MLCLPASPDHLFFLCLSHSLSIANWQQGFNSPPPPFLLSDELLAGDQRGVVPTVHHAHHYLLAHMNVGTGALPRGHRPATHCQEAEVNTRKSVCVWGGGWLEGWCVSVHFLTEDSISQLILFVSFYLSVCISLSHTPLSLLVADQQQVEADWEGVQSEARQVCPGNQFSLPPLFSLFHFIFLFFTKPLQKTGQMSWWERWGSSHESTQTPEHIASHRALYSSADLHTHTCQ